MRQIFQPIKTVYAKLQLTASGRNDRQLGQLSKHILAKSREGFPRMGSYMTNFRDNASVTNDCITIDSRVAIPTCLRKAVMARLHRTHPGEEAMMDAAKYLWWPKMLRENIDVC